MSIQEQRDQRLEWLFLDLNSFFASAEQNENPNLIGKPVAVVPMQTDSTCAIAASYEAKSYGVKTGMKIYEAKKICPDLICIPAHHHKYVEYNNRIMDEINRHIPITKKCSIDEVACRLLKNEQSVEYVTDLTKRIKNGIKQNIGAAMGCSVGIAPSAYLAKTASNMQKPDGFTILSYDRLPGRLLDLKLTDLTGIAKNIERRLNNGGIYTIEQFWNTSPKHARKIWGSVEGERFWYKLHGTHIEMPETQTSVVGHSRVLEPKLRAPDKAYSVARYLTVKAAARLRSNRFYARKLSFSARCNDGNRWGGDRRFTPSQDNTMIVKALETMWRNMLQEMRPHSLLKISISLSDLYQKEQVTLDLFETTNTNKSAHNTKLSKCIDALNQKYGSNTVNLGNMPDTQTSDLGTKIAFTRIPDISEF